MREVIKEAKSVEEAIDLACQELGVDRGDAEFEIITLPKRGFLGLRNTPAKVRVYLEEPERPAPKPRPEHRPEPRPKPEQRRREEAPRPKMEKTVKEQPKPAPVHADAPKPEPKPEPPKPAAPERAEPEKPEAAPLQFVPAETVEGKARTAADYVQGVLAEMGVAAEISVAHTENGIVLRLSGEGLGVIIGRRGETLDALQYLSGLVANRQEGDYMRVTIDSGNYRQKRERTLEQLAKKLSASVFRSGRPSTLEPMNPYERRIIHATVSRMEGVTSASIGEEPNRRVVISPTNPRPQQGGGRGGRGGRGPRPGGGRDDRGPRDSRGRGPREGGFRDRPAGEGRPPRRDDRSDDRREGFRRGPREEGKVTPTTVDQEYAKELAAGAPAFVGDEPKPVTREVVPPTRAQARKEGEDLPLYGKIEL